MNLSIVGIVTDNSPNYITRVFQCWSEGAVVEPQPT
jgi:hypothetical protein